MLEDPNYPNSHFGSAQNSPQQMQMRNQQYMQSHPMSQQYNNMTPQNRQFPPNMNENFLLRNMNSAMGGHYTNSPGSSNRWMPDEYGTINIAYIKVANSSCFVFRSTADNKQ